MSEQFSYSKVNCYQNCPYQYKLKYVDNLKTLPDDAPNNALYLGIGVHTAIEKGIEEGVKAYYANYPIITDAHINEVIKFEQVIPKVKLPLGEEVYFEYKLECDKFIGFIDLLVKFEDGTYGIYDFKYSNNIDSYLESGQIHVYKYFLEKLKNVRVSKLGYIFIPKSQIKQKKDETLEQFRSRIVETLKDEKVKTIEVLYQRSKVDMYFDMLKNIEKTTTFEKNETKLCYFCQYKDFCQNGDESMLLPKNERRIVDVASRKKIWIYGAPFSGKTTLANGFPDPIMLNTDGNINSFDAPYISIKDTKEGRLTKLGWTLFKEVIDELEVSEADYKTIVVDLVEDVYELCRRWCYKELNITHESDNSFKAWDFVRNEFLNTFKKLLNLDYNVVLISHEDISKDITKKTGDKVTAIRPNIQDKLANKLAGMVDIVGRVTADGSERILNFKSDDVVFGGGRLKLITNEIPCTYTSLDEVYKEQSEPVKEVKTRRRTEEEEPAKQEEEPKKEAPKVEEPVEEEQPRRRRRRIEE